MCGIMGAMSQRDIGQVLLEGLRRLEYRGYDSAGMAGIDAGGRLRRIRTLGKVHALSEAMFAGELVGRVGIAHTRWATHGKPSETNAHPHVSSEVAVVHNGIIENHDALRARLIEQGYIFTSETDTEVAAHLIHDAYKTTRCLLKAVQLSAQQMHGAFALAVIHQSHPDQLVAVRHGSPLVIGCGVSEHFVASDTLALRKFAQDVIYLEDGDSVRLHTDRIEIYDPQYQLTQRSTQPLTDLEHVVSKGTYRHFMLKEIFDQPVVLADTLSGRIDNIQALRSSFGACWEIISRSKAIHVVACGTSYHAGLVAKYWLESLTGLPAQIEIASEYRYRDVVVPADTLFVTISQSGETADTLAGLNKAKKLAYSATLTICNVESSSLVRESDAVFLTRAGTEIGVASTKAFTTQLAALLMLAAALCQDKRAQEVLDELKHLPEICERALLMNRQIEDLSLMFVNKEHALFLGRGVHYPVALEGALKLKEISYIHAEAYPAGELKHGPLALVDHNMPVVVIAPNNALLDKLKSNLHEVSARGGQLVVFANEAHGLSSNGSIVIQVPDCGNWIAPMIYTVPLQFLAYHVAVAKGTDVDQPRNLAKSVTVE